jgi:outer membrane protein TolC
MPLRRALQLIFFAILLRGQDQIALRDAVHLALTQHPSIEAATARIQAAGARIAQARSGWLPQATYTESFQSGDNPVYVFGSLLTQHQFTAANFDLQSLNRPDALNNFQSQLTVDQKLYDFGATRAGVRSAEIGKKLGEEDRRRLQLALIVGVARAYHGVALAEQGLQLAEESLKAAQSDLDRARSLNRAGLATDADVLSVQVQASAMSELRSRRDADLRIARAALNDALGLPLDTLHVLTSPLEAPPAAAGRADLEHDAVTQRPELAGVRLAADLGTAQERMARSQYWPAISLHGVLEADRQDFIGKGGGNWMFAASLRWNVFDGGRARAQAAEARSQVQVAKATAKQMDSAVRLEVRRAEADFDAARERVQTTAGTVAQAEESLRIIRNRYSNGLTTVTDLLRAESALTEAKTRRLYALYDSRIAAIQLAAAAGSLNGDSDVLK